VIKIVKIKLGKFTINKTKLDKYIAHLNIGNKSDLQKFEDNRKQLHDAIFLDAGIDRLSKDGIELSRIIDRYCTVYLTNAFEVQLKRISSCANNEELKLEEARMDFIRKWQEKNSKPKGD